MPKILIGLSVLFLTLSAVFGVLNTNKAQELRATVERSNVAQTEAEQARIAKDKELKAQQALAAAKATENEARIASAESDFVRAQAEKNELQARINANQNEIAALQQRLEEATTQPALMPDTLPMPGAGDLQAQLEETRRQLDDAEREKQVLTQQLRGTDRGPGGQQPRQRAASRPGVRGTILAVNQSYNFVVLNLGNRQGVEANSEMLVLRGGSLIGRIRVSSVEPATAIGDIITSSLPRGVQVQPGDTVVYAGSGS